jgi:hypothetical protein
MTITNHALTGALIAVSVGQPVIAVPLAFVSHFALDAIPHFGISKDLDKKNRSRLFSTTLIVDMIIGAGLFLSAIWLHSVFAISLLAVWAAMFAAVCPDLIWGYRFYRENQGEKDIPMNLFSRFHSKIQWFERSLGLAVEFAWMVLIVLVLWSLAG